jgi:hypothetical protein
MTACSRAETVILIKLPQNLINLTNSKKSSDLAQFSIFYRPNQRRTARNGAVIFQE